MRSRNARRTSGRDTRRVLMLVENLSVPADPRVWLEARALREDGHQVCIICPKGRTHDVAPYDFIDGIHIYRYTPSTPGTTSWHYVKEYGVAMLKTLGLSFKLWRRHGFDVIHAANPPDTFFAIGLLYKLLGKRYIFDQHDLAPEVFRVRFPMYIKRLGPLLAFLEVCSYRTADVVITTNDSQKTVAIGRGGCRPEKIFVVRNGPDLPSFRQMAPEPELKGGRRFLLAYIGEMGVQDGVDYALRALHELVHRRGRRDVSLVLMGDGDQLESLKALAHELDLDSRTTFAGWVGRADLLRYLSVTDVGLTPDPSNELNDRSTMLKTMEYMAMSRPLVAFDTPETRYCAMDAALYAAPNLVGDFADKIEALLDDDDLRLRMGVYGRRRIEHDLCWDRAKAELRRAYESLF